MRVLLITDPLPADLDSTPDHPLAQSIAAIEQAIVQFPLATKPQLSIIEAHELVSLQPDDRLCPLTLNFPASRRWQGQGQNHRSPVWACKPPIFLPVTGNA